MASLSSMRVEAKHIFLLCVVATLILLCLIGQVTPVDHLIMVDLAVVILWFLLYKREVLVKYFYFMVVMLWSIVDVYMAETQSLLMPNLETYSYHTGGLPLLVLSFCVFLLALSFFDARYSRLKECPKRNFVLDAHKARKATSTIYFVVVIFSFALLALCDVDAMRNGFFTSGLASRYEFNASSSMFSLRFYSYIQMLIPLIAIYARKYEKPWILFIFSAMYLAYLILIGNKFGALLLVLYISFIAYFFPGVQSREELDSISKKVLFAMLALLAILVAYSFFYTFLGTGSALAAVTQFQDRVFSGQGDVWWGVYAGYGSQGAHLSELGDELQAFNQDGLNQLQYNFAIYKMMNLIAPQRIIEIYAMRGIRFTMSTDASLFYYFGWAGLLVGKVVLAWFISRLVNALIYACSMEYAFESFIIGILLSFGMNAANMSEIYLFLTKTAICCYLALCVSYLYRNKDDYAQTKSEAVMQAGSLRGDFYA